MSSTVSFEGEGKLEESGSDWKRNVKKIMETSKIHSYGVYELVGLERRSESSSNEKERETRSVRSDLLPSFPPPAAPPIPEKWE